MAPPTATSSTDSTHAAPPLKIPKELWQLVDFLFKRGMDTPLLCVAPGVPDEVMRVREALDTATAIDSSIRYVGCDTLNLVLE